MDISELRQKINEIDDKLSDLFVARMNVSADIGAYKLEHGMNIRDRRREKEVIDNLSSRVGSIYAPYISALYTQIIEMSRRYQSHLQVVSQIEYGLIGGDVSNSYAKWIHHSMGNSAFGLYSLPLEMLPLLFQKHAFRGLCIGAPYKKEVIRYCDELDSISKKTGCVNTIVKEADNTILGYNTEYDGFVSAAKKEDIDFKNKKIMLLGNGSIASSVQEALKNSGASDILNVTRTGKINFRNYSVHSDIDILINATSVGSSPESDIAPVDISVFSNLCGVIDCVYTPVNTMLILNAKSMNIPCVDGLSILIASSAKSSELFGFMPEDGICEDLYEELLSFIE